MHFYMHSYLHKILFLQKVGVTLSHSQPYPVPYPSSRELSRTCLAPSLEMFNLLALSRVKSLGPDVSNTQVEF
jgi:hypothetical protein